MIVRWCSRSQTEDRQALSAHLAWPAAAQFCGPFLGGCYASIGRRNTGECVRILGHLKPGLWRLQKTRQQARAHFVDSVLIGREVVKLLCLCSNNITNRPTASVT